MTWLQQVPILMIRGYRLLFSPLLPPACRYWPTCSLYAEEALSKHGVLLGGALTAGRLLRCQPWGGAGHDPVPEVPMQELRGWLRNTLSRLAIWLDHTDGCRH